MSDYLNRIRSFKAYTTETSKCKVKLSSNESPFDISDDLMQKITTALSRIKLQRYPDPTSYELKEIIADHYGVKPQNLVLGNGSDELIQLLVMVVGSYEYPVLFPVPTFPMYQVASDVIGRQKVTVPLNDMFELDQRLVFDMIDKYKPQLAFFASPNNPTGNHFDENILSGVASKGVFTVVDEAYIDFSEQRNFVSRAIESDCLVVLRTLSKIGLAGIRLGVLIASEDLAKNIDKARAPFNITYPTQLIAKIVLTQGKSEILNNIAIIKSERKRMISEMQKIPNISVYPSEANFILIRVNDGDDLHRYLLENGILVRSMTKYANMKNCLRISVGKPEENSLFLKTLYDRSVKS